MKDRSGHFLGPVTTTFIMAAKSIDAMTTAEMKEELERLCNSLSSIIIQRERILRRFNGDEDFREWREEAEACLDVERLDGVAAANFVYASLEGEVKLEIECRSSHVRKSSKGILDALSEVFGAAEDCHLVGSRAEEA